MPIEDLISVPREPSGLIDPVDIPSEGKSSFWNTYEPEGAIDTALMGKRHNLWAIAKVVESFTPLGKMLGFTRSGKLEWDALSTGEKFLNTALDIAALTPAFILGTGFKTAGKLLGVKKFFARKPPKFELEALETIGQGMKPFKVTTLDDVLIRKWQLNEYEALASGSRKSLTEYIEKTGIENISEGLKDAIVIQKTGYGLRKQIRDEVTAAGRPREFQMWDYYEKEWGRVAEKVLGSPYVSKENRDRTLKALTRQMFGDDAKAIVTLQSASPKLFHTLATMALNNSIF